jgi:glycosyltransferase involved in cell wall biosynthesis
MRIVHVITRLIIGGAQENTVLSCRGLAQRGHDVTLVAGEETGPEGSLWDQAEKAGCVLARLPAMCRRVSPAKDFRAYLGLRRLFEKLRPDVVHTHSSKAGILGRWAAHAARVPAIVHTIHGMSFNRTQSPLVRTVYRLLERDAARLTTKFVSVADAMTEQAVAARLAERERFVTIRSGMETDRFTPRSDLRTRHRAEWGVGEDEIVVGTVARLFENKGYEEILAALPTAAARCPNLRFVWIGDGAHRTRYEAKLREIGLFDRTRLLGLVSPDEVASLLNGFDMLVHASRWEGLPRAVVQALLTQVPAVSFDNDGAPEVVIPRQTGLLVPLGDVGGLSDAIVQLAHDPALRLRLGQSGRQRCREMFDWQRMVRELEALYQSAAETARTS